MQTLESHYRDMCDIEFTIEQGRLFMLQTRVGKRTAAAALRMAVEMEEEGLIDKREAVLRVQPAQLDQLLHPQFDPKAEYAVLAKGLNASPGAAVGQGLLHRRRRRGTTASRRGRDPRAARDVARRPARHDRGRGHPHVARRAREPRRGRRARHGHARDLRRRTSSQIDVDGGSFEVNGETVREGDVISINGTTGEVVVGEVAVVTPEPTGPFGPSSAGPTSSARMQGAHQRRPARRRAKAREFGAEGIGLCRTEHMFLGDRLPTRAAHDPRRQPERRRRRSAELEKLQRSDFVGILEAMDGLPVTIRLLDPPLHEFLPDVEELLVAATPRASSTPRAERLLAAAQLWREANPMLGTRGCRLGILKPGLYRMQVRAIIEAAVERKQAGGDPQVEIMIPLIVSEPELALLDRLGARGRRRGARRRPASTRSTTWSAR